MYTFFFSHLPNNYTQNSVNLREKPWIYSNWYPKIYTNKDGIEYTCVEQEMMHQKALLFGDLDIARQILETDQPKIIKALGRKVRNFDETVWDEHKYNIVLDACRSKFNSDSELMNALKSTKGMLVEASPYDRIWGIGFSAYNAAENYKRWGENLLGKALTQIRDE